MVSEVTTTSSGGAEGEEWEKEEEHICQWSRCKQSSIHFETIEALLEHVNEKHIPTRQRSADGQEAVVCKWAACEMSTTRGDLKKKTEWMKCHFKTRHARSAKLFKCLFDGCDELKATSQELEIHVRRYHSMKPKKEKKPSPPPEPEPTNQIFEIHGLGRVSWKPAPIVTKPTVVEYSDGPRYVFPDGYVKADLDRNGELLADDEYWEQIHYFDYHHLPMVPSTSKYQYNMPRSVFKRAEPNRPTRIRRKMTEEMIKARDARRRKEAGLPPIDAVRIRMPWREEEKKNELERSPCKQLEKEISPPPEFIEEAKVVEDNDFDISDIEEMPKLKAHYEEDSEVETSPKKADPRTPRSSVSPRKSLNSEVTPSKTGAQTRKLAPMASIGDSESATATDSDSDSTAVTTTPRKRIKILTKRVRSAKKNDSEDSDSESEGVTPPPEIKTPQKSAPESSEPIKDKLRSPRAQKMSPESKKTPKTPQPASATPSKRPSRSCKSNFSCLSEQDAELVWKVILESPMKENLNSTIVKDSKKTQKEIQKSPEPRRSPRKSEVKNLKRPPSSPRKPPSPCKKRPSRACRALGSMEEVPFDVEIQLEV